MLYFALFHSNITFGIELWGKSYAKYIDELQICQNKSIKTLYNIDQLTATNTIHKKHNILKLADVYEIKAATHIHSIIHRNILTNTTLHTNHNHHQHNTRTSNFIHNIHPNTTNFGTHSTLFNAINSFNQISCTMNMNTNDRRTFTFAIKEYFLSQLENL
jgi:hypothetical protein